MNICENFIVEHERKPFLNCSLGRLPIIQRAWALVDVAIIAGVSSLSPSVKYELLKLAVIFTKVSDPGHFSTSPDPSYHII